MKIIEGNTNNANSVTGNACQYRELISANSAKLDDIISRLQGLKPELFD